MSTTSRYRKAAFGLLLAMLLLTALGESAVALSCIPRGFESEFIEADAVFIGRVVDLDGDFSNLPTIAHTTVLRFRVEASWKGVQDRDVSIRVGDDDLDLPILLRYYVFSQRDAQTGELFTWACTGPAPAHAYGHEIAEVLADQPKLELHGGAPFPSIHAWRSLAAILWLGLGELWPKSAAALLAQGCIALIALGVLLRHRARRS